MKKTRNVFLPNQFALDTGVLGNPVRQISKRSYDGHAEVTPYNNRGIRGEIVRRPDSDVLVTPRGIVGKDGQCILICPNGKVPESESEYMAAGNCIRWSRPKPLNVIGTSVEAADRCLRARESWRDQFIFREERYTAGALTAKGLRPPQIGALHAALSHWTVSHAPATVVMPTGTGKTDTMIALLIRQQLSRLLVIVPTDPLREQIATRFLCLGVLQDSGCLSNAVLYPVVGTLRKRPKSDSEVSMLFQCCNVVVATMGVLAGCTTQLQAAIAAECSHLFIDEAHHITAPSWATFRKTFENKAILQFTATPFRGDGKHVDGKIIFNYPLRKAQAEEYFRPITFIPVVAYERDNSDLQIADKAINHLEQDLRAGRDHFVMARVKSISRAEALLNLYAIRASKHNPILIHSRLTKAERHSAFLSLRSRKSRIVICVDMLGEGFDFPELKIAALHDMHKSLAITLQFTGRFTRSKPHLGNATVIANTADADVEEALRALYSEDADWNIVLRHLSEGATGRQVRNSEFLENFQTATMDIPLQNIFPKMSTVVYRTSGEHWQPERYVEAFPSSSLTRTPAINQKDRVLLFVTRDLEAVPWGEIRDIQNVTWHLYLLHWDETQHLLFIHSSNNDSLHESLAKAVAGGMVSIIRGESVFRVFNGVKRILLMNLGLSHSLSRAVRFIMYVGNDIREGLSQAHLTNKMKSNTFGRGYENGSPITVGCSYKGRIWSYRIADNIPQWIEWCRRMGVKLLDEDISWSDDILPHVLIPTRLESRPPGVPLVIEWSEYFLKCSEELIQVEIAGQWYPLVDVGLELSSHMTDGPIRFKVTAEGANAEYEVVFSGSGENSRVDYRAVSNTMVTIKVGHKQKSLTDWLQEEPPVIRFSNGMFLIYNDLFEIDVAGRTPFDPERVEAWDWSGVDMSEESQTYTKSATSIQYRVIQALLHSNAAPQYDIVFDDDAANEAADIVAIAVTADTLILHLYHCKYTSATTAGARVDDMYAVCGQAQRSVFWKGAPQTLLEHLEKREARRKLKRGVSRFEKGNVAVLRAIKKQLPFLNCEARIFVVQPGLSKNSLKQDNNILDLLATTELYLSETHGITLGVIGSA